MSSVKTLAQLGTCIAAQHGWPAAKAFKAYHLTDADRAALSLCAIDLLNAFPKRANASALMSAALAVSLERRIAAPIQVVAGTLSVLGVPALGDRQPFDGAQVFAAKGSDGPDSNWNGHVWVMIGASIIDISMFRKAYAPDAPGRLSAYVERTFGPGKGLYVDAWKHSSQQGLGYEPQYVLSADEITSLMGEAFHVIKQARP